MNEVIDLIKSHRSIRKFTDQPIDEAVLKEILTAGQQAPTSTFVQGTTVIRVRDKAIREQIAELAGPQEQVVAAAEFLVFCADLKRATDCCQLHDVEPPTAYTTEQFIIATIDVALFAQNCAVAAESTGLGFCYVGGIRNDPAKVTELLKLPKGVYPVFGFVLGYPDQDPELKPRLPLEAILKEDVYSDDKEAELISEYDPKLRQYYLTRSSGQKDMTWTQQMATNLAKQARPFMKDFLFGQGFEMK